MSEPSIFWLEKNTIALFSARRRVDIELLQMAPNNVARFLWDGFPDFFQVIDGDPHLLIETAQKT